MTDKPEVPIDVILDDILDEVVRLRMEITLPSVEASGTTLLESLLDTRRRLDRIEELYANTLRIRAHLAAVHTAVRIETEDAWDTAAVNHRQHGLRDEYSSAKERTAAANLHVLDLRRVERTADKRLRAADAAVEFVRARLRGCEGVRQDLLAILRNRQFESTLDR